MCCLQNCHISTLLSGGVRETPVSNSDFLFIFREGTQRELKQLSRCCSVFRSSRSLDDASGSSTLKLGAWRCGTPKSLMWSLVFLEPVHFSSASFVASCVPTGFSLCSLRLFSLQSLAFIRQHRHSPSFHLPFHPVWICLVKLCRFLPLFVSCSPIHHPSFPLGSLRWLFSSLFLLLPLPFPLFCVSFHRLPHILAPFLSPLLFSTPLPSDVLCCFPSHSAADLLCLFVLHSLPLSLSLCSAPSFVAFSLSQCFFPSFASLLFSSPLSPRSSILPSLPFLATGPQRRVRDGDGGRATVLCSKSPSDLPLHLNSLIWWQKEWGDELAPYGKGQIAN